MSNNYLVLNYEEKSKVCSWLEKNTSDWTYEIDDRRISESVMLTLSDITRIYNGITHTHISVRYNFEITDKEVETAFVLTWADYICE